MCIARPAVASNCFNPAIVFFFLFSCSVQNIGSFEIYNVTKNFALYWFIDVWIRKYRKIATPFWLFSVHIYCVFNYFRGYIFSPSNSTLRKLVFNEYQWNHSKIPSFPSVFRAQEAPRVIQFGLDISCEYKTTSIDRRHSRDDVH